VWRWLPAVAALAVYAIARGRRGVVLATVWALGAVTITVAAGLSADPIVPSTVDRAFGPAAWIVSAVLVAPAVAWEPTLGRLPRATLLGGLGLLVAVCAHVRGLNGPAYWQWTWQRLEVLRVFPAVCVASLPFFAARALHHRQKVRIGFVLGLLGGSVALLAAAILAVQPAGLDRMHAVIESTGITAYYADAAALAPQPGWMDSYPERLWGLHVHARTKPPGPIVFYGALIRLFGGGSASAVMGALLIAMAAGAGVPAVYLLARQLDEPADAAFEAACTMAVCPSLLLFFPELDQAFPLITCLLLYTWSRAVSGSRRDAVWFGLAAFAASFFSYSFLVLGVAGVVIAARDLRRATRAALVGGLVLIAAYALLGVTAGFDPVATFRMAVHNQSRLAVTWGRTWGAAVRNDPWDFAMGAGWIAAFLALVTSVRAWRARAIHRPVAMGGLQVAIVDLTGLLRVEAARVWLLLTPFVAIPAGRELARWTRVERTAAYAMMVLLLAALAQNMTFIDLGPAP
jgi:hypothetical protein